MLLNEQVERLVIHHKDRLLRFGSELIFSICKYLNVEVVILENSLGKTFEQELSGDVIEIMTVFSSKLYGRRAHLNKTKKQEAA
jgi:predicted site-specific integrase-resolvase